MVNLQVVSDVHTELHGDFGVEWASGLPSGGADALIVAGDYGHWPSCVDSLKVLCERFPLVLYITGNHEYYGTSFAGVHRCIETFEVAQDNFNWLHNRIIDVCGQRVLGTTLWYKKTNEAWRQQWAFSDFVHIIDSDPEIYNENRLSLDFLNNEVREGDVVVTHHMPTRRSTSKRFLDSSLNCYFVCPMDPLIAERRPKLWIHGHTHDSKDFHMESGTRIVCNPQGYVGILNPDYEEPKVVAV